MRASLVAGQKTTVRTGHGTTDWFQTRKGVHQGCILSSCLFILYAVCIMRNSGLEEAQAGTKIARRNINKFIHAYDTTLMAESRGTKSILMKVKEKSEKSWLKTQHSKNEDHGIQSHLFQNFPQFIVIHTAKGFGIVNKAEVDVFLKILIFVDPTDVDNLICHSSAF